MASTRRTAKPKLLGDVTGNALVSGVVSAIVAGLISFFIAHYQTQDADRQANAAQQASAVVQLESAATTFYQQATALGTSQLLCPNANGAANCPAASYNSTNFEEDQETFNADRLNVSDPAASKLADNLNNFANQLMSYSRKNTLRDRTAATKLNNEIVDAYFQLIDRCGRLVQG